MEAKLKDFIKVENVLPETLCKELVDSIDEKNWSTHTWYNPEQDSHQSHDEKELDIAFPGPDSPSEIRDIVSKSFQEYATVTNLIAKDIDFAGTIHQCSGIRLNRYTEGAMMRPHFDHIHSLFDGQQKGIPVLSMIGVLNEEYEGGDLVFGDDYKIETKTGDIVIFPSCFLYPHQITEVTKGTRYSFVSWGW